MVFCARTAHKENNVDIKLAFERFCDFCSSTNISRKVGKHLISH